MSIPAHKDPAVISRGRHALAEMRELCTSLVHATILTDDGFEVVRIPPQVAEPGGDGRLASMSSSIQALSGSVSRDCGSILSLLRVGAMDRSAFRLLRSMARIRSKSSKSPAFTRRATQPVMS